MVLMIDTTAEHIGTGIAEELRHRDKNGVEFELIDTASENGGEYDCNSSLGIVFSEGWRKRQWF